MADDNLESDDDLWGAAADDLEKQREMLREEVENNPEGLTSSGGGALAQGVSSSQDDMKYARVLDIPLTLSVEMGKAKMLINDLLQLGQGSVIELTKLVGEPLDVLVNDKLVAKGEVVVVNEKFGVRLTEVITPQERIENLG